MIRWSVKYNNGVIVNDHGLLDNNNLFNNLSTGNLRNAGDVNNRDILTNDGTIDNLSNGIINNFGTIDNNSVLEQSLMMVQ